MGHLVEHGDMWGSDHEEQEAIHLLPLLESICQEIVDRLEAIEELEFSPKRTPEIRKGIATHRAALELAFDELRALGCAVSGTDPLEILIAEPEGTGPRSLVWEAEDPALHE